MTVKRTLLTVMSVLLLPAILVGCQPKTPDDTADVKIKKQVTIQTIQRQSEIRTQLTASGTIVPKQHSIIRSLTPGTVEFIAEVGSPVSVGQPLFSIHDTNIENAYLTSSQNFQQTAAITDQRVQQAELALGSAQARLELAQKNLDSAQKSVALGIETAKSTATVSYNSAYTIMSQVLNFLSVGDVTNLMYRYRSSPVSNIYVRADADKNYSLAAEQFLTLPLELTQDDLVDQLNRAYAALLKTKLTADLTLVIMQGNENFANGLYANDQLILTSYQAQINQNISSLITSIGAVQNAQTNGNLAIEQAKNQLELTQIEAHNAEVSFQSAQDGATLEQTIAQSQLNNAAYNYGNLTLASPFAGTILSHFVKFGEQVSPGQQLVELGNLDIVEIEVFVDADFSEALAIGDPVTINDTIEGFISQLQPGADVSSGKLGVIVQANNTNANLTAGDIGDVAFTLIYQQPDLIVIPIKAATIEGTDTYVLVSENGIATKRSITLGRVFGNQVSVTSGLTDGDQLIVPNGVFVSVGDEIEARSE